MAVRNHVMRLAAVLALWLISFFAVEAVTYSVASMYLDDAETDYPAYSVYAIGVSIPATQNSGGLDYSVSLTATACSAGNSLFKYFSAAANVMALFGPAGTNLVYNVYSSKLNGATFVMFAPLSQSVNHKTVLLFLTYMPQVYWAMASEQAQAAAFLSLLASRDLFAINQLFFRVVTTGVGLSARYLFQVLAPVYGVNIPISQDEKTYTDSIYKKAIAANPRIVYQCGQSEGNIPTARWNSNLVSEPTLIQLNATIATTFEMQYEVLQAYISKAATGAPMLPPENFVTTIPVPGVEATEYAASVDFLNQAGSTFPAGMPNNLKNYMMAGWVSGTALMQALNKYTSSSVGDSDAFYQTMLADQSSYVVSDLFIGTFVQYDACSAAAVRQGMICTCHHGGNNIWFQSFAKSSTTFYTAVIRGELYQYGFNKCANLIPPGDEPGGDTPYDELISTPVPIHVAGFAPTDNTMMETVCTQTHDVITRLSNTNLYQHTSTHTYRGYCIPSAVNTVSTALATHTSTFVMTSMMGVMPDTVTTPTTLVLDYTPQTTQPHVSQANLVYLFPTLEQDLYVLASYLGGIVTDASVVCAAVGRSTVSGSIVNLLRTTLTTFGISLPHGHVIQSSTGLGVSISDRCTHTFAIGMGEDDAAGLLSYLQTNANSYLLVPFDDLTKYYTSLSASLGSAGAAVTNRFLFATNIPLWTSVASNPTAAAASAPLSTVSQFLQSVPVGLQTPAAVRAYFVAMLYDQLSAGEEPQTGDMQQRLYDSVSVTVSGVEFGPFSTQCIMETIASTETTCLYNYGARGISVWSYTSVADPSIAAVQDAVTPSMVYDAGSVVARADLPYVVRAAVEDCVMTAASSDEGIVGTTTTTVEPIGTPSTSSNSVGISRARSDKSNPGDTRVVDTLLLVGGVSLSVVVVIIVLLLLLRCCALCVARRRCDWSCSNGTTVLNSRAGKQQEDFALQRAAQDSSRAPSVDATQPLTVVCVDVAHFRALWTTAPDVMSCAVADYQRCVRQSIVRHGCYEVNTVDGLFVIACCTADAGVRVALDCAAAAQSLDAKSATAVNAAYAALGLRCAAPAGCGLRLRIAVHCGPASTGVGAGARFRGGAVDDAVCAAYCSKVAWQVVVTESARCSLADAAEYRLSPLGRVSLVHGGATELFAVTKQQLEGNASSVAVPLVTESSTHVLRALDAGVNRPDAVASGLCRRYLEAFLAHCCGVNGAVYVTAVAQCLGLSALSRDDYEDEDAYFAALLRAVCGRLGALLECRHGVASESVARKQASGVSWSASVETSVECCDGVNVSTAAGQGSKKRGNSHKHRKATRPKRPLFRHFSYTVMENVED